MAFGNNFFDLSNFTEPAHGYLDGQFFWDLMPGFRKKTDIFVRKNKAELNDDIVQLSGGDKINFYQILDSREQIELEGSDGQFASVYIRYDAFEDRFERRVYSFGDLLGQVGGIYEFMLVSGILFVKIFSERLLISSILNKIYQIDDRKEKTMSITKIAKKKSSKLYPLNSLNTGKNYTSKFKFIIFSN